MALSSTLGLRFAIYARVSTEQQAEKGESLAAQEARLRSYVKALGGEITRAYIQKEHATEGYERASLFRLLAEAKDKAFDAVMVRDSSRWTRDPNIASIALNELRKHRIRFFVGADEQNLSSPEGRFQFGLAALVDELHASKQKYAASDSRLRRAKRGWPIGGKPPFARLLINPKANRNTDNAEWGLDPEKLAMVRRFYRLYIEERKTLGDIGRITGMNPETVRRILVDQSGPNWARQFSDPDTEEKISVVIPIPPLLSEDEIEHVRQRAKENQLERNGWGDRKRSYPLMHLVRCANQECGWSNFSGHQTYDKGKAYAYYIHLPRKATEKCAKSVSAELLEDEIFSRIGQFLKNSKELELAVQAAIQQTPEENALLESEQKAINDEIRGLVREQEKLLCIKLDETPFGERVDERIKITNERIVELRERLHYIEGRREAIKLPDDFPDKLKLVISRLSGLNGNAPMHWPPEAKRILATLFFGSKKTRFDRTAKHEKSSERGIFIQRVQEHGTHAYWIYEAKGIIGDIKGALTSMGLLYDAHSAEVLHQSFSRQQLGELARAVENLPASLDFRVRPYSCTRWSG